MTPSHCFSMESASNISEMQLSALNGLGQIINPLSNRNQVPGHLAAMIGHNRIVVAPEYDQRIKGADLIHLFKRNPDIFFPTLLFNLGIKMNKGAQHISQDQDDTLGIINSIVQIGIGHFIIRLHQQPQRLVQELRADNVGKHIVHIIGSHVKNCLAVQQI